jgi:PAS domain S-box-containing protein
MPLSGSEALVVLDHSPDAMLVVDAKGQIRYANEEAMRMFGYGPGELIGLMIELLIPSRFRLRYIAQRDAYSRRPSRRPMSTSNNLVGLRKDGVEFPVDIGLSPLPGEGGPRVVCAIRDLSERRALEAEVLAHRQHLHAMGRMIELGRMASSITHEIRNPLTIALSDLHWLLVAERGRHDVDEARVSVLTQIENSCKRIAEIVKSLLAHARCAPDDPMRPVSLATILEEAASISRHHLKLGRVDLIVTGAGLDRIQVCCQPTLLSLALVNLINNAGDAVRGHAERWIRVAVHDEGESVVVLVSDSGPQIPEEIRKRILSEVFTTKAPGQGTGLGLALARSIAERHGGTLTLDSDPSVTQFILRIPKVGPREADFQAAGNDAN